MSTAHITDKKFLMKYVGGSQLYGLNTPESDVDWRGVYINTTPEKIFRFRIDDSISITGVNDEDEVYYELWRFFDLLRKTNTQIVESLYVDESEFNILDPTIKDLVLSQPNKFINSAKLVNSTKGYAHGEYRLAMGERTGKLGGKRFSQLQEHGFSPKNVCQMIRLSYGLRIFQENGVYPLKLKDFHPKAWEMAYEIKTQPENFTKEQVNKICLECLEEVSNVEDKLAWTFDENLAVDIMHNLYNPYLV